MKKIKSILLLLSCWFGILNAQTTDIPVTRSSTNSYYSGPIYRSGSSSTFNYSRHSHIYSSTELNTAGIYSGDSIVSLAWNKGSTGYGNPNRTAKFYIYLKNSSTTSYTTTQTWSTLISGATLVFSDTNYVMTSDTGFITFTFPSGFAYSGGGLEIMTEWAVNSGTGDPSTGAFTWYYSTKNGKAVGNTGSSPTASLYLPSSSFAHNRPDIRIGYSLAPCSNPPTAGLTHASDSTICLNSILDLYLTGNTFGSGMTYQWQSSPDSITWNDISGATADTLSFYPTSSAYYHCILTCGQADTSSTVFVALNNFLDCYCAGISTGYPIVCITDVKFNSLVNSSSSGCTNPAYGLYDSTTTVTQGDVVPVLITNCVESANVSLWIDYDHNGVFDASEWTEVTSASIKDIPTLAYIQIPLTAQTGETGMRIRTRASGNPNGAGDACTIFGTGECEDYRITILPSTPCTNPPDSGTAHSYQNAVCADTTFTLYISGNSATSGLSYQWQSSPDTITWTDISGATNQYLTTSQTQATYYRCVKTCAQSAVTNVVFMDIKSYLDCYCISTANYIYGEEITNVTLDTFSITSSCSTTGGSGSVLNQYSNYTGLQPLVVTQQDTIPFSLTVNICNYGVSHLSGIYVDWNHDSDFDDADENPFVSSVTSVAGTETGYLTIPATAKTGLTYLRVIVKDAYGGLFACGEYPYGETEDYYIQVDSLIIPPVNDSICSTYSTYNCIYGDYIDNFTFNTISNLNSGCSSGGYSNPGLITEVSEGNTYSFTAGFGNYPQMLALYIDLNGDLDFADSGEMVYVNYTNQSSHSGSITIPSGTPFGPHRMRVISSFSISSFPSDGCGFTGDYSEVEDYTVYVLASAGPDIVMCTGNQTYMNATLPANASGIWTKISGVGTIITPTSPVTQIKNLTTGGTGTFVWTVTSLLDSSYSTDTVVIRRADIPSNITITAVGTNYVTFSWTATADPDSFWIRVTENCTASGGINLRVPGNVRSYTVSGLKGCSNYCVKLRTQCPSGNTIVYSSFSPMTSFATSGPVSCAIVNTYSVTGVQGCTYNVSWANGCVAADSFRVRYRSGTNPFVSSPFTTGDNINLNLGVGTWEFRIQTWCNGVSVGLSPAGNYFTISNCSMAYGVALSQNSGCNYKVQWETCGVSDSFRVRYRTGSNAYANTAFTTNNYINLNLAPGSWDFRVQNWCGNAVAGLTNPYNFNIASCRMAGIQEPVTNLVLFPNPTSSKSLLNFTSAIEGAYILTLTDLSGRVLKTIDGSAVLGENSAEISAEGFAKGVYFVGLTLNGETRQIKLIVQ